MKTACTDKTPASVPPVVAAETILVVDDQPPLCELVADILERSGYRVLKATNGEQAMQLAQQHREIRLLVTDVEMPDLPGDELARWFHLVRPQVPVVFMSADPTSRFRLGAQPVVDKPFGSIGALVDAVDEALHFEPFVSTAA